MSCTAHCVILYWIKISKNNGVLTFLRNKKVKKATLALEISTPNRKTAYGFLFVYYSTKFCNYMIRKDELKFLLSFFNQRLFQNYHLIKKLSISENDICGE